MFNFPNIKSNEPIGANDIFGNTILSNSPSAERNNKNLYEKLVNSITYNTTGINREMRNIGDTDIESW